MPTHVPVPRPEALRSREWYRLRVLDLLTMAVDRARWATGANERQAAQITRALLEEIEATARGIGAVPVFVYLPVHGEIADSSSGVTRHERLLADCCDERHVRCLFLRRRFADAFARGTVFDTIQHWRSNAHAFAARAIAAYLSAEGRLGKEQRRSP